MNWWSLVVDTIFKSKPPEVEVEKVWVEAVRPFKLVMALPPTRVEVDIQEVPVPVEERIKPLVPEALDVSKKAPVNLMFPATERSWAGEVVPIPTFPVWVMVKRFNPVADATAKGLRVPEPVTSKVVVELVALTPATVPLSIKMPMPVVEAPVNLVT